MGAASLFPDPDLKWRAVDGMWPFDCVKYKYYIYFARLIYNNHRLGMKQYNKPIHFSIFIRENERLRYWITIRQVRN